MKIRALVPLAEGFEEIEAITIVDLLRRAGIEVVTASIGACLVVKGAHDISVQADGLLSTLASDSYDAVVLPGGMPGTSNLSESRYLEGMVRRQEASGGWIGAICAAPSALAKFGVIDGKKVTCYPGFESKLGRAKVDPSDVVVDDHLVTSRGPGTAISFALVLIEKLVSPEKANEVARAVLYQNQGLSRENAPLLVSSFELG